MALTFAIEDADFHVQNMHTRFPFKYGIASLTALPHLFLRMRTRVHGIPSTGLCAEHLPPKWFTKNPHTTFEEDLPDLFRVVTHAAEIATALGSQEMTFFAFWQQLYQAQKEWADSERVAPLLANLGVSMVERAVIDAICRHLDRPFGDLLRENLFGIDLGAMRPEIEGMQPSDAVPAAPLQRIISRHTVGLGDPLVPADIAGNERLTDGLPHDLQSGIKAYGTRYFKIKLSGDLEQDGERLRRLAQLFEETLGEDYHFTLDGNENFTTVDQFVSHWDIHHKDASIQRMMKRLLFVEQPFHRDVALDREVKDGLSDWNHRPPMIIDESDDTLDALPCALELGYAGTSHKNCKGIVKGLANAALLTKRRREFPNQSWILSGEDLANVGPIALLQDLCVMASFGIGHVERNGHHYFKGLDAYPESIQRAIVDAHGDLYMWRDDGFAAVKMSAGQLSTTSVTTKSFGVGPLLDIDAFTPLADWQVASLEASC